MQTGRSFSAKFADNASKDAYYTWSAGQMMAYNAKVAEQQYFDTFDCKFWCPVEKPAPDQKYAHLVSKKTVPWLDGVPSAVIGIGAYQHYQARQRFHKALCAKPCMKKIKGADRFFSIFCLELACLSEKSDWCKIQVRRVSCGLSGGRRHSVGGCCRKSRALRAAYGGRHTHSPGRCGNSLCCGRGSHGLR